MDDLKDRTAAEPAPTADTAPDTPKRRTWLRVVVALLAILGLLFVALLGYMAYKSRSDGAKEVAGDTTFDEAEMVDRVMTDTYGKYSDEKRGWLYVHNSDQTYVMRVIHQVHMDDTPGGNQLYMLASGTPINGDNGTTVYGFFHIYPDPEKAGGLKQASSQEWQAGQPLKPEDVRFAKLNKTLWAWILKVKIGDGRGDTLRETVSIVAPHQEQLVTLAQFPAAIRYSPDTGCAEAKRRHDEYYHRAGSHEEEGEVEEEPLRCQDRRWSYKLGNTNTNVAAPITITVSGTVDQQPIDEKTWKVVFDSKVFRYILPDDIESHGSEVTTPAEPAPAPEPEPAAPPAGETPAPSPAPAVAPQEAQPVQ